VFTNENISQWVCYFSLTIIILHSDYCPQTSGRSFQIFIFDLSAERGSFSSQWFHKYLFQINMASKKSKLCSILAMIEKELKI
jgi:hypothetical protein